MTTLEGSVESWWLLSSPSPKVDFRIEMKIFCELAAKKYGSALRAIIVLKGPKGEFYIAQFWNDMQEGLNVLADSLKSIDYSNPMQSDPVLRLMHLDSGLTPAGTRGDDWKLPNQITVFYFYPDDLIFPEGWKDIPQKILE